MLSKIQFNIFDVSALKSSFSSSSIFFISGSKVRKKASFSFCRLPMLSK
jgi:hypothetical protein